MTFPLERSDKKTSAFPSLPLSLISNVSLKCKEIKKKPHLTHLKCMLQAGNTESSVSSVSPDAFSVSENIQFVPVFLERDR